MRAGTKPMPRELITPEYLRSVLRYDAETGALIHRESAHWVAGKVAGSVSNYGYRRLNVQGNFLLAHRIVWAMHFGEWPAVGIDHINGDRLDNRLANLRLADQSQNCMNARLRSDSTTGVKGVSFHRRSNKYAATICFYARKRHLGLYVTADEAHEVYCLVADLIAGEFANHG